jgi:phage-related minor tail protein
MIGADKISTPTTSATSISYSAKGDVFDKGYITDGALMRNTNYGISMIGEDGREAVMPLTRSSSGKLGVQGSGRGDVYVNVTNNTSAKVTQEVRENRDGTKSIEFLITETVKRGMASGVYDNTLQKTYGNVRRGR